MLKRVLIDEALEMYSNAHVTFGGRPERGGRRGLVGPGGQTMDPLAQRGIGKRQCVGDGLEALAFDHFAHGRHGGRPESLVCFKNV